MNYGVIDIGSNTIRLVVYNCTINPEGRNVLEQLFSGKETVGLANYAANQTLSHEGIERACSVLLGFQKNLKSLGIQKVSVFATASLRNVSNTQEAVGIIHEKTGFSVNVLSGEEEARLDFAGASYLMPMASGGLVDIGGGSTEFVQFKEKQIINAASMPFGSLSMYRKYVSELLPTAKEYSEIKHHVREALKTLPVPAGSAEGNTLCGLGGSIRACAKLMGDSLKDGAFPAKQTDQILENLSKSKKQILNAILRAAPDRVHTIIPGMIILQTIADYFGYRSIWVSSWGVREGYLLERILPDREAGAN